MTAAIRCRRVAPHDQQPTRAGGRIDRSRRLNVTFDGRTLDAHRGDTLASALLANGVTGRRPASTSAARAASCQPARRSRPASCRSKSRSRSPCSPRPRSMPSTDSPRAASTGRVGWPGPETAYLRRHASPLRVAGGRSRPGGTLRCAHRRPHRRAGAPDRRRRRSPAAHYSTNGRDRPGRPR